MIEQDFRRLLQEIENKTFVGTELSIDIDPFDEARRGERLKDDQIILLTNALKKNPFITKVNLCGNNIEDTGAIALASVNTIEELDVSENCIGISGAQALAKATFKKLSLEANLINFREGDEALFAEMITAFIQNNTITDLNLTSCDIPSQLIGRLIAQNTTIKTLYLDRYLQDNALEFISSNSTLEQLYIPENVITDRGAEYIASNTSLKILRINESKITNIGAKLLSNHLSLKELYIRDSDITLQGAQVFIGSNLENFCLSTNKKQYLLSRDDCSYLNQAFYEVKNFNELSCLGNAGKETDFADRNAILVGESNNHLFDSTE